MTVRRSAVAALRRAPARPSRSKREPRARRRRASGLPTRELAGSTKAPSASAIQEPPGAEVAAPRRPALPMTAQARWGPAVGTLAQARPMWARPLRAATPAWARPSSARGRPEPPGIPRSEAALERRREQAAERGQPANPRWAPGRLAVRRARPRREMWRQASLARLPVGPSLVMTSAAQQSSGQQGSSASPRLAEPRSTRHRRSDRWVMRGEPAALPSCAYVSCASSDRGRRRTGPPPPGLCPRIQLASGGEPPFRRIRRCISDSKQQRVAQNYGIRLRQLSVTRRSWEWLRPNRTLDNEPPRCDARHGDVRLQGMSTDSERLAYDDMQQDATADRQVEPSR
jgi:hypothetical protein